MKYAFLIMGEFDSKRDRASMCNGNTQMIGVSSVEQACREAKRLQEEGVACIELCGAFGESRSFLLDMWFIYQNKIVCLKLFSVTIKEWLGALCFL